MPPATHLDPPSHASPRLQHTARHHYTHVRTAAPSALTNEQTTADAEAGGEASGSTDCRAGRAAAPDPVVRRNTNPERRKHRRCVFRYESFQSPADLWATHLRSIATSRSIIEVKRSTARWFDWMFCHTGNIVTASPISDLNPCWMALGATLHIAAHGKATRTMPIRDFFTGYHPSTPPSTQSTSRVPILPLLYP